MKFTPAVAASFFLALAGMAGAQVINIDFDESSNTQVYQGLGAAYDPNGAASIWNRLTGSGTTTINGINLIDSDGEATGVDISFGINGSFLSDPGQQQLGTWEDLMTDYVYISAPTQSDVVTLSGLISGLDAGKLYDVYFYGQGNNFLEAYSEGQNTLFTIGGVSKQTSWDGIEGGDGLLAEGIEYVKFSVFANLSGEIAFDWANVVAGPGGNVLTDLDGQASRFGVINGIQIVDVAAVPEPSAAVLGGLGLLLLIGRRRRK
jgi:MYXO-CTERM domain-containing protein